MRIDEINTRLSAIASEIDTAAGETLAALEQEVAALTAERQQILDEAQTRQQLRANMKRRWARRVIPSQPRALPTRTT